MLALDEMCIAPLRNTTAQIVNDEISNLLDASSLPFCQCDMCLTDIAAMSLNALPAWYEADVIKNHTEHFERHQNKLQEIKKEAKLVLVAAIAHVSENKRC